MSGYEQRSEDLALSSWVYAAESKIHGRGLFAARAIEAGSYIGTFDGPVTDTDDEHVLWVYQDDGSCTGKIGANLLRFVNHASTANAEFDGFELFARCDIAPGQEITIDYNGDG